jgi:hypothetical protein
MMADNKISTRGLEKPLGNGERRAIEEQHRNQDEAPPMAPTKTDMDKKTPRRIPGGGLPR